MAAKGESDWRSAYRDKRARDPGTLRALRRKYWFWISAADRELREALLTGDTHTAARMMHACNQLGLSYHKIVFGDELAQRMRNLERSRNGHVPHVMTMEDYEKRFTDA